MRGDSFGLKKNIITTKKKKKKLEGEFIPHTLVNMPALILNGNKVND